MRKKVIAAGHICLDITPAFPAGVSGTLPPGKLLHVGEVNVHTGGSVANTGLAMKRLGADVRLAGKVGDDAFGRMAADILRQHGSGEGLIVDSGSSTSYSIVIAPQGVDRTFLHHPGANDTFRCNDISDDMLTDAVLFHFGYPPLMRQMWREDGKELRELFCRAKEAGCMTSLDMAAVDPSSEAGQVDWKQLLANVLPFVDFFVPSVEELGYMLDRPLYEQWQKQAAGGDITLALNIQEDVQPLARKCLDLGTRAVLIKCGAPGLYWHTAPRSVFGEMGENAGLCAEAWANKSGFEASYLPKRVLSGTGAGDVSIAAFLCAMLEGEPPEMCVSLAAAAGACCVEEYDALSGLPEMAQLRAKIAAGWPKQHLLRGE